MFRMNFNNLVVGRRSHMYRFIPCVGLLSVFILFFGCGTKESRAPKSAHDALAALKKLEARTEMGINYREYTSALGDTWVIVKIFVESKEADEYPKLKEHLSSAIDHYKSASESWGLKVQGGATGEYPPPTDAGPSLI